ncbi:MAG: M23 family metallopeptidase [Zetaproteobacteria bacterium]|nr:MAG: M23 family metallopeptidase [Zetaproteobacteria bacterium]
MWLLAALLLGMGGVWYGLAQKTAREQAARVDRLRLARLQADYRRDLAALQRIRLRQREEIDRLIGRLGMLDARLTRLDALGRRLVARAGLDTALFDFDRPPAVGGGRPVRGLVPGEVDVDPRLDALLDASDRLQAGLDAVGFYLMLHHDEEDARPHLWPAPGGWISSRFGRRSDPFTGRMAMHRGVDIANRQGADVLATASGMVLFAGFSPDFGRTVLIDHGYGYRTRYAHLRDTTVRVGDEVAAGDCIGHIGSSGRSTGPHLHYEVHYHGMVVDPVRFLPRHHG